MSEPVKIKARPGPLLGPGPLTNGQGWAASCSARKNRAERKLGRHDGCSETMARLWSSVGRAMAFTR
jgi:hypothetical protein